MRHAAVPASIVGGPPGPPRTPPVVVPPAGGGGMGGGILAGAGAMGGPAAIAVGLAGIAVGYVAMLRVLNRIEENTRRDVLAFAPKTLEASIQGQLSLLEQNMTVSEQLDSVMSGIVAERNGVTLELRQLGRKLLELFGPLLSGALSLLNDILTILNGTLELLHTIYNATLKPILEYLGYFVNAVTEIITGRFLVRVIADAIRQALGYGKPKDLNPEIDAFFRAADSNNPLGRVRPNVIQRNPNRGQLPP